MRSPTKNFELFSQITAVAIIVIITIDSQGKLNEENMGFVIMILKKKSFQNIHKLLHVILFIKKENENV